MCLLKPNNWKRKSLNFNASFRHSWDKSCSVCGHFWVCVHIYREWIEEQRVIVWTLLYLAYFWNSITWYTWSPGMWNHEKCYAFALFVCSWHERVCIIEDIGKAICSWVEHSLHLTLSLYIHILKLYILRGTTNQMEGLGLGISGARGAARCSARGLHV